MRARRRAGEGRRVVVGVVVVVVVVREEVVVVREEGGEILRRGAPPMKMRVERRAMRIEAGGGVSCGCGLRGTGGGGRTAGEDGGGDLGFPLVELGFDALEDELDLVRGLGGRGLELAELVGFFAEALEADFPDEHGVALGGAVGEEEVGAAGRPFGVLHRRGAAPGCREVGHDEVCGEVEAYLVDALGVGSLVGAGVLVELEVRYDVDGHADVLESLLVLGPEVEGEPGRVSHPASLPCPFFFTAQNKTNPLHPLLQPNQPPQPPPQKTKDKKKANIVTKQHKSPTPATTPSSSPPPPQT